MRRFLLGLSLFLLSFSSPLRAQSPRFFEAGRARSLEELPPSPLRTRLENLANPARARALAHLATFGFPAEDTRSLRCGSDGSVYYACEFPAAADPVSAAADTPVSAAAAVPVSPFPAGLKFHSKPGSQNVLFLDFDGATISGTQWNTDVGRTSIPAVAFSVDADYANYSDAEQAVIKRVWQRVAEDYAPFDIDVTTEAPATFNNRTCQVLVTRNTDADLLANPSSGAGGVAYVGIFNTSSATFYRPAWVYSNNLSNDAANIAEAASHEAGHNMGLSHDGLTSGSEYYGGHGSGATSWGPIMGTGYGRSVSQWSKGEYYLANNTEDDLALIAAKLAYRADDAGGTITSPAFLTVVGGTSITSTTPESDPANANPANKGRLERNTDVDVWAFTSGTGPVSLRVDPFVSPAGTAGSNVDIVLNLLNSAGTVVAVSNPATTLFATLATNVTAGSYYLSVRGTGVGTPTATSPTGYTVYGVAGQYFISGTIPNNTGIINPPQASLAAVTPVSLPSVAFTTLTVTYTDDVGVDVSSLDGADLLVTGPNGYSRAAAFQSVDNNTDGTPRVATYRATPTDNTAWRDTDNGVYTVTLAAAQAGDVEGAFATSAVLGTFTVAVPLVLYSANMTANPGWTFSGGGSPGWAHGQPTGGGGNGGSLTGKDPTAGYTGANVIGYNLSGNYQNNLAATYATTPAVNCSGSTSVTIQYRRWLGLRTGDTATLQVNGGAGWVNVTSLSADNADTSWQLMTHDVSATAAGKSAVQFRWGHTSNASSARGGWNIDDVVVFGNGAALDATPPTAALVPAALTTGGQPLFSFQVSYDDDDVIAVASLGTGDILVTGPAAYSNLASFVGVDNPVDGAPRIATYQIPAPGGLWDAADNGAYSVALIAGEVEDATGNTAPAAALGSLTVNIAPPQVSLSVSVNDPSMGSVNPSGGTYASGTTVQVTATPAAYHLFSRWEGAVNSTVNPVSVTLNGNVAMSAFFIPQLTVNHPTPLAWLAEHGITANFETAVDQTAANGMAYWESYVAGVNPNDPASALRIDAFSSPGNLHWPTMPGRVYSLGRATEPGGPYTAVAGATNLPWTVQFWFDPAAAAAPRVFYRVGVQLAP